MSFYEYEFIKQNNLKYPERLYDTFRDILILKNVYTDKHIAENQVTDRLHYPYSGYSQHGIYPVARKKKTPKNRYGVL